MKYISLIILSSLTLGCATEIVDPRQYPRINTLEVTNITETGAFFNAKIIILGDEPVVEQGFIFALWNTLNMESSQKVSTTGVNKVGEYQMEVKRPPLEKGKKHFVRAYVKTASFTVVGDIKEFVCR